MTKNLNIEFEKAVRLLAEHLPVSDETTRKPVLFHDIRVGVFLYEKNYSPDIVLAGLLHDALEFSEISEETLSKEFGETVLQLVLASTKDASITDKNESTNELIMRCTSNGQNALIVKIADIIDSFKFYSSENNTDQLKYCMRNANAILEYKPDSFDDKIFDELKVWQNRFSNLSE
ncbi:HD domain-containing protein [Patescibacteria group bacterium]|nr:HD domain-containing protein [Patescibacteria group bacterium]